ncbi:MAG: TIGR02757 family protein, partial [Geobacter sp.]|nr:TIGR02757 family protein [Geobacter sp.]
MTRSLKTILDTLYEARSQKHLANDPLSFCRRYPDPVDREVVGFIAAAFAYGNVKIILRNLETIFAELGERPRLAIERFEPRAGLQRFSSFKHRFNDGRDLCALLYAVKTILAEAGSIEAFFLRGFDPADDDIGQALDRFSAAVLALDHAPVFGGPAIPAGSYFPFFFPAPAGGSACKRACMFLRWMVRPDDGIDLGLWRSIPPSGLVIPVDAHILRIGRFLRFTSRRQGDWKTAREITASLRLLDPADPVKYDFSLCHLGISEGCGRQNRQACLTCDIA